MAFWSKEKLIEEFERYGKQVPPKKLVDPFVADRIAHGAYEMGVCRDYAIAREESCRCHAAETQDIEIPPGHFALLMTEESIFIPPTAIGFISVKASYKLRGLINVSGFHVDPGFEGRLKFSVYNAGNKTLHLDPSKPLFSLWYCALDKETAYPYGKGGKHFHQARITNEDLNHIQGIVPSPAGLNAKIEEVKEALKEEMRKLEKEQLRLHERLKSHRWLLGALVTATIFGALKLFVLDKLFQ